MFCKLLYLPHKLKMEFLTKISLTVSIIGILALYLLSFNVNFNQTSINTITPDDIGRSVKVCGTVENKFTSDNGHVFFSVNDGSTIRIVAFNSTSSGNFSWNSVCVTGRIDIYNRELEVITQEVVEYA